MKPLLLVCLLNPVHLQDCWNFISPEMIVDYHHKLMEQKSFLARNLDIEPNNQIKWQIWIDELNEIDYLYGLLLQGMNRFLDDQTRLDALELYRKEIGVAAYYGGYVPYPIPPGQPVPYPGHQRQMDP